MEPAGSPKRWHLSIKLHGVSSTLEIEAGSSSETLVRFRQTLRCHIPEKSSQWLPWEPQISHNSRMLLWLELYSAESFFRKQQSLSYSRNSPPLAEPGGSLPLSQGPVTGPLLNQMNLLHILQPYFYTIHFKIILPSIPRHFRPFPYLFTNLREMHKLTSGCSMRPNYIDTAVFCVVLRNPLPPFSGMKPEDGDSKFHRNVSTFITDYTASHSYNPY
jgi:hypothetical protein